MSRQVGKGRGVDRPSAITMGGNNSMSDEREENTDPGVEHLAARLLGAAGKPIDEIPHDSYCYTNHLSGESIERLAEYQKAHPEDVGGHFVLWVQLHTEITCPYWESTDHGTYRCNFLEEEGVGWGDDDYEKALSYFGSEEAMDERCQGPGMELWDQIRCCTKVVDAIRNGS